MTWWFGNGYFLIKLWDAWVIAYSGVPFNTQLSIQIKKCRSAKISKMLITIKATYNICSDARRVNFIIFIALWSSAHFWFLRCLSQGCEWCQCTRCWSFFYCGWTCQVDTLVATSSCLYCGEESSGPHRYILVLGSILPIGHALVEARLACCWVTLINSCATFTLQIHITVWL